MHSKKVSIVIGLIVLAINIFLMIVYFQKQGRYSFDFIRYWLMRALS